MIPELGTREDFKASVMGTCSDYPVPGEVYTCMKKCSVEFSPGDELLVTGYGWKVRYANLTKRARNQIDPCEAALTLETWCFAVQSGAIKFTGYVT